MLLSIFHFFVLYVNRLVCSSAHTLFTRPCQRVLQRGEHSFDSFINSSWYMEALTHIAFVHKNHLLFHFFRNIGSSSTVHLRASNRVSQRMHTERKWERERESDATRALANYPVFKVWTARVVMANSDEGNKNVISSKDTKRKLSCLHARFTLVYVLMSAWWFLFFSLSLSSPVSEKKVNRFWFSCARDFLIVFQLIFLFLSFTC